MIIAFIPKSGRKDVWEIIVEGEKWRDVHRTIFGANPLFPPISSADAIQTVFDEYEYRRVKGYLLWLLSRQGYHSEQLAKMLRERLVQEKNAQRVLQELQVLGYINDEAWLNSFIRGQQTRYGLPIILNKLRSKGLSPHTLKQLAESVSCEEGEEVNVIHHLLQTRYRSKDLKDRKTREKVFAALARKGFSFDNINTALNRPFS